MTQRRYLTDSYSTDFNANVLESFEIEGKPAVILDQTYFYPTGGGQPNDTGTINSVAVTDVITRPTDLMIVHVLERELPIGPARGEINWQRRFDHMQQHTGQHILTQAFVTTASAATVGFHLSRDTVTIDLDQPVTAEQIDRAELLANDIVFRAVPVLARDIRRDDLAGVRIRRIPDHVTGDTLRVISIGDFDHTACGGTHVSNSGQIGVIKVIRSDRKAGKSRVEFRCGYRALQDYGDRLRVTQRLASQLSTGLPELIDSVTRLQDDFIAQQRQRNALASELLALKASALLADAQPTDGTRVVTFADEVYSPADLRQMAALLTTEAGVVALLGVPGEKAQVMVAISKEMTIDARPILSSALEVLGGRGGGTATLAQGGGLKADIDLVRRALSAARDRAKG